MKNYSNYIFLFFLFVSFFVKGQSGFQFDFTKKKFEKVNFTLINNLIVIPIEINGQELSFILDTGVSKSILFNLSQNDSIGLYNVEKVELQGLGGGMPVQALLSKNNRVKLNGIVNQNESIYVILKDYFDLSSKMGVTIHGIIGYSLLRNFLVKINYNNKTIRFYKPQENQKIRCRKCESFPLEFHRKKPYINLQVQLDTIGQQMTDVKLLIDSGGSDALWLFEDSKENIQTPNRYFDDILGEGLSGTIYGKRSRIKKVKLNAFEIENPTVSFLDSVSTRVARNFKERNGSLGGNILKRFTVWLDYKNQQLTLKKSKSFSGGFEYNMSGMDVVYSGKQLVRQEQYENYSSGLNQNVSENNSISFVTSFSFNFKPSFRVKNVIEGSPADIAGVKKNDIIQKINGAYTYNFELKQILGILRMKHNKKINLVVERNGELKKISFRLKRRL